MGKSDNEIKISKAKGRPMLTWVGKKALEKAIAYPAQKIESFSVDAPEGSLGYVDWAEWPEKFDYGGLLFHGDNKDVLAHLLANGFRGKVKLIYIDPPFDSGADYVRKVQLRGKGGSTKLEGEEYTLGEQIQYTDIWANDNYLQFMYERLLMQKELLANDGVLVLHCDWKKSHHLRCLLDEVFGQGQFKNEIYWYFYNKMHDVRKEIFPRATNTLLVYTKTDKSTFHRLAIPRENVVKQLKRVKVDGVLVNLKDEMGELVYQDSDAKTLDNIWGVPLIPPADVKQKTAYPTQKPEALLELAIQAYTNPGDLVLDSFVGSGTTVVAAQRWGRRWVGCDINKGAIQTTAKRLHGLMQEQFEEAAKEKQGKLVDDESSVIKPAQLAFTTLRINDYDLQIQHNEAVELASEHIGITRTRSDSYFDGRLGNRLVKITPFNHPLSPLDLEDIDNELKRRPEEQRDVTVVCLGIELAARAWVDQHNKNRPINRYHVIELRTDSKYGGFIKHEPLTASVDVQREGDKLVVKVTDVFSPTIMQRLNMEKGQLLARIDDWRGVVDCIMIDTSYDGEIFNVVFSDIPEKKTDLVDGRYELPAPEAGTTVAVKVIDMLGEEVILTVEP